MTENVARFPMRDEKNGPLLLTDQDRELFKRERLERIKEKMQKYPMIKTRADRQRVANNMWQILAELEGRSQSIKKKTVLHAAGLGSEYESTKRLPRYAIDPMRPEEDQQRRAEAATKKIAKYAALARTAATLADQEPDHFIPALVEGTRYALLPHEQKVEPDEASTIAWKYIVSAIQSAAKGIAQSHDLQTLFDQLKVTGIRWSHDPKYFDLPRIRSFSTGRTESYESIQIMPRPALVSDGDLPPCPSVFLGRTSTQDRIPCEVYHYSESESEPARKYSFRAYAVPALNMSLELLPYGRQGEVKPALRIQAYTRICAAEETNDESGAMASFEKGEEVGFMFGRIDPMTNFFENDRLWTDPEVMYESWIEFSETLEETYSKSTHAKFPQGGSLIVMFDEHARTYLDETMDLASEVLPYCSAVEDAISASDTKDYGRQSTPFFGDNMMLAALERSLTRAPHYARLDRLLDREAGIFAEEAKKYLSEHYARVEAERLRDEADLERIRRETESIAREYGCAF